MGNSLVNSYVDTDVIIRLFTGDDEQKRKDAKALFEKVEKGTLEISVPDTVIADAVFVLSSPHLYGLPRNQIRDLLAVLLRLSNFKVENKQVVIKALDFYVDKNVDFGDAMLAVLTRASKNKLIYSYDHDFDKIEGIIRKEP
ncbi:MAG: putative nucleic acid-binding protein [Candidatus Gottesmanbacteria bacterium GW2011_GWA1_43_11]|uniref:Putative nucleic acid-binding protein n=1 Tax=Candidatus Gottesmanbacteria bacterium GW2011_GWA1_43_11 TaxID=1618436 RepID=A0A0G1CDI1_9BACT|nr:MAG: putative nucleic acid-binding protein [Candidatus Gottesmanbacteria bacterium GW2011_GWA1_43_11]